MADEQDREQKSGGDRADLGEGGGKPRAHAADLGRENLAGQQVGLRVRAEIGHEVEQHEAGEDQGDLGLADDIDRERGEQQARPRSR